MNTMNTRGEAAAMERRSTTARRTQPALLLRIEGAVVLALAVLLYWHIGASWLMFALLLLAPDLAMLGYLGGSQVGATAYNIAHTYLLPAILTAAGLLTISALLLTLSLIWFAHIGMDRAVGYGLKYSSGFHETHFDRV